MRADRGQTYPYRNRPWINVKIVHNTLDNVYVVTNKERTLRMTLRPEEIKEKTRQLIGGYTESYFIAQTSVEMDVIRFGRRIPHQLW